jgi:hypothetical protein
MTRQPSTNNNQDKIQNWIDISSLNTQFQAWLNLLKEYETVNSFFDDPITKAFEEEFYSEFEIIEENADKEPFKTKQILFLDEYLETVSEGLKEQINDQNKNALEEIQEDISTLRNQLTVKSKKWVVKYLSKICAKIAKQGIKFIKEFLSETKKEIIKQSIKRLVDYVKENGQDLLN